MSKVDNNIKKLSPIREQDSPKWGALQGCIDKISSAVESALTSIGNTWAEIKNRASYVWKQCSQFFASNQNNESQTPRKRSIIPSNKYSIAQQNPTGSTVSSAATSLKQQNPNEGGEGSAVVQHQPTDGSFLAPNSLGNTPMGDQTIEQEQQPDQRVQPDKAREENTSDVVTPLNPNIPQQAKQANERPLNEQLPNRQQASNFSGQASSIQKTMRGTPAMEANTEQPATIQQAPAFKLKGQWISGYSYSLSQETVTDRRGNRIFKHPVFTRERTPMKYGTKEVFYSTADSHPFTLDENNNRIFLPKDRE